MWSNQHVLLSSRYLMCCAPQNSTAPPSPKYLVCVCVCVCVYVCVCVGTYHLQLGTHTHIHTRTHTHTHAHTRTNHGGPLLNDVLLLPGGRCVEEEALV